MKKFEVWMEGYLITGMEGIPAKARQCGTAEANSFDEAVKLVFPEESHKQYLTQHEDGTWTYWGCSLFDNATDACRSFG